MKGLMAIGLGVFTTVVLTAFRAGPANEPDKCYMVIFTYQGPNRRPREAHTFASFVRARGKQPSKNARLETHTISWLPANLQVALLRLRPEPGKNLGLEESLDLGAAANADIAAWGPFQIRKDLYDRALAQIDRLNTGQVGYKAIDTGFRPDVATNCFHAISDIGNGPLLNTGLAYADDATEMVIAHLSDSIVDREEQHPWLIPRLGLDKYKISYRK